MSNLPFVHLHGSMLVCSFVHPLRFTLKFTQAPTLAFEFITQKPWDTVYCIHIWDTYSSDYALKLKEFLWPWSFPWSLHWQAWHSPLKLFFILWHSVFLFVFSQGIWWSETSVKCIHQIVWCWLCTVQDLAGFFLLQSLHTSLWYAGLRTRCRENKGNFRS